jgi:ribulose 1,5-bisphosphate synthetase/thiazole synthase
MLIYLISMIKKALIFLVLLGISSAYAETIKTDVLVVGGGAAGTAAAIQSARSKVKTLLVEPGPWLGGSMTAGGMSIMEANRNLPAGIWGEFRKHVINFYKKTPGYDTTANAVLKFEPYTGAAVLKKIADTVKNLTVKMNTPWTAVNKDGAGWEVTITVNGKPVTVKTRVLIDGTEYGDIAAKAGAKFVSGFESRNDTGEQIAPENAVPLTQDITWVVILKDQGRAADRTIPKPEGYDPSLYLGLKDKDIKKMIQGGKLPNDKYMIKWNGVGSNTYTSTVSDLAPEHRDAYYKHMRLRTLGLVYYLQTEFGLKSYSLSDEFPTPDKLPLIPYIREDKRAIGRIRMVFDDISTPYDRVSKLYRTSIAVGDAAPGQHFNYTPGAPKIAYPPIAGYSIPLGSVIVKDLDNLLVTEKALSVTHIVNASTMYPSVQMSIGQGAGTVAAFCAFFKTTTKNINVRAVQTELLDYKGWLMPFVDVNQADPDFRAVQQIGATGLLRGIQKVNGKTAAVFFMPDSAVATDEVKPVLTEIYTRAFLWFNRVKPTAQFTIGNTLSFISEITLNEPKSLQANVQKDWKEVYKFTNSFDMNRAISRREFAVLVNKFINPYARNIDLTGKLVN